MSTFNPADALDQLHEVLDGAPVQEVTVTLCALFGEIAASLPKPLVELYTQEVHQLLNEVFTMSKDFAEAPTLN